MLIHENNKKDHSSQRSNMLNMQEKREKLFFNQ